jgi:hypothetical protein
MSCLEALGRLIAGESGLERFLIVELTNPGLVDMVKQLIKEGNKEKRRGR